VIQPWYSEFHNWAFHQAGGDCEHIVLGNPGIGKSVFGVYFMARLIASDLSRFYKHRYFALSRKSSTKDRPQFAVRITLKGKISNISSDDLTHDTNNRVFRLLDGWSYDCDEIHYPVPAS
jgi:hypothetical protein